ncbi:MAG: hypothetical protein K8R60_20985 [Burkholderiales bacterium]|nr:hypothetical protein [Burkholderiales bacterium]
MSRVTTAREALIVEVIGDVNELITRVEALKPAMSTSHRKLSDAAIKLGGCVEPITTYVRDDIVRNRNAAIEHVRKRTGEIAAESMQEQILAMRQAARAIIEADVRPELRQLSSALHVLVERTRRPQWETWATYAATGTLPTILAVGLTWYLMRN